MKKGGIVEVVGVEVERRQKSFFAFKKIFKSYIVILFEIYS